MTQKDIVILCILRGSKILLRSDVHENQPLLDVFAVEGGGNVDAKIVHELQRQVGTAELEFQDFGIIENIIHKPSESVQLHIRVKRILVDANQADTFSLGDANKWYEISDVLNSKEVSRISYILERIQKSNPMNVLLEENQFGEWSEAETVKLTDI